ncbi:hypothetical protein [Embleya sp. AB8]|uniref:hypothetical protein n=1 Tax=Embleya sp. AB8 TaxID=3156304 RepID=UPI003C73C682
MRRKLAGLAGALVLAAGLGTAGTAPAAATGPVGCGGRADFFRMWTQHHGFPICYATNGSVYYGNNPPKTTWTTYGFCSGNNSGYITYWVRQTYGGTGWLRFTDTFRGSAETGHPDGTCIDYSKTSPGTVEVVDFGITGR